MSNELLLGIVGYFVGHGYLFSQANNEHRGFT